MENHYKGKMKGEKTMDNQKNNEAMDLSLDDLDKVTGGVSNATYTTRGKADVTIETKGIPGVGINQRGIGINQRGIGSSNSAQPQQDVRKH